MIFRTGLLARLPVCPERSSRVGRMPARYVCGDQNPRAGKYVYWSARARQSSYPACHRRGCNSNAVGNAAFRSTRRTHSLRHTDSSWLLVVRQPLVRSRSRRRCGHGDCWSGVGSVRARRKQAFVRNAQRSKPEMDGVPGRVRTCNLLLRREPRYPVVPRGRKAGDYTGLNGEITRPLSV